MTRITRKEWYRRVNALWPAEVPPLTPLEAIRAARKLYRFVTGKTFPAASVRLTSGNRFTDIRRGVMFVSTEPRFGRHAWDRLVHELSHTLCHAPHGAEHARLEMRMIREVLRRGWLNGTLKDKPKIEMPAPDKKAIKYARTLAAIKRWTTKATRAENALKKLNRSLRAQERAMNTASVTSTTAH